MNTYYAAGFLCALAAWIWPVFLFHSLEVHWVTAVGFSLLIWQGGGRAATEIHLRFIAPRNPPKGSPLLIAGMCAGIAGLALLTRAAHLALLARN
jgi:hypothetical protein